VPEGDTLHRAAKRLQALVGERIQVEARHPRAAATGVAQRLDGRVLECVEAYGKNLLLRFEGGYVLRSHLRMSGSWRLLEGTAAIPGRPWLVLRGGQHVAVLRGGSVLELHERAVRGLGPDILDEPPDFAAMLANLRKGDQRRAVGDALLDQRLVSGIGNLWRAEALWRARLSPWLDLAEATDDELLEALRQTERLMRGSLETGIHDGQTHARSARIAGVCAQSRTRRGRGARVVYRRTGRPCPRCGEAIRSRGQGDANRTAYWCPGCQRGKEQATE
jgi:endonuclease VIII